MADPVLWTDTDIWQNIAARKGTTHPPKEAEPSDDDLDDDYLASTGHCEDFPCCGHTRDDPCSRQAYDDPEFFDTSKNPHALCNHQEGECEVDYDESQDDEEDSWDD